MAFISTTPLLPESPNIPYDHLALTLHIDPLWKPNAVSGQVSFRLQRYRVIEGQIDRAPSTMDVSQSWGDIYEQIGGDSALGSALTQIESILQDFITAKGL